MFEAAEEAAAKWGAEAEVAAGASLGDEAAEDESGSIIVKIVYFTSNSLCKTKRKFLKVSRTLR